MVKRLNIDEDWNLEKESDFDTNEDVGYEQENIKDGLSQPSKGHHLAAIWILLCILQYFYFF